MLPKGLKSKLQHIYDVLEANNHLLNQLVADREKKLSKKLRLYRIIDKITFTIFITACAVVIVYGTFKLGYDLMGLLK